MNRSRRAMVLWLLFIGLGFIVLGWLAESALFMDLGAHSTNSQAFEIIKEAVDDDRFASSNGDFETRKATLDVATDASRAVMASVRYTRSLTMWIYAFGVLLILAGFVLVVRTPGVAVLDTGE